MLPETKAAIDSLISRLLSREGIAAIVGIALELANELNFESAAVLGSIILGRSAVKAVDRRSGDGTDTSA